MSSASIKKIIPCKKKDLINMVLDIEKYPEFVPWCIEGKIHEKKVIRTVRSFSELQFYQKSLELLRASFKFARLKQY